MIELGGEALVFTHDTLVEGVHFFPDSDAADIAWKLVAVNLSDLAAKGAEPLGVLISHMLGDGDDRFIEGLREVLERYGVALLGGDTVRGDGSRVWGCTAIGRATHVPVPSRSGAQPGDAVWIGGPIGAAMLGYEAIKTATGGDTLAYSRPHPQLELGQVLARHVSAMMDVSDGLLLDAKRIAAASQCTISIDRSALIPLAPQGRVDDAMRWGDDYVLLCTGPDDLGTRFPIHRIGTVQPLGRDHLLVDGKPVKGRLGYSH